MEACERASARFGASNVATQSYSWLSREQPTSFSFLLQESSGCFVARLGWLAPSPSTVVEEHKERLLKSWRCVCVSGAGRLNPEAEFQQQVLQRSGKSSLLPPHRQLLLDYIDYILDNIYNIILAGLFSLPNNPANIVRTESIIQQVPTHLWYNQDVREDDGGIKWKSSQRLEVNKKKKRQNLA